jgi:transcriptional regulator GlxA family with amidase domain
MTAPRNVAILLFPDVEVLDFCGPYEVFSVAARQTDPPAFSVYTVAERNGRLAARNGLSLNPDYHLTSCPPPDVLVIPGGLGTRKEMHNTTLTDWIKRCSARAELVLSVCTGALLLAKAGLLDGLEATTHHSALALLHDAAPRTIIRNHLRFVDNGRVVLSAGIATGIDMSLHVVGRLLGAGPAQQVARHMEYPYQASSL